MYEQDLDRAWLEIGLSFRSLARAWLEQATYTLGWPISPIEIVTPYKVAEVSVTMLNMKSLVIYLIHITTAVKSPIVPDLHQTDIGLHYHK